MSRRRKDAIPLTVDVDGFDIPAVLRPPRSGRVCYEVRWKVDGGWKSRSTGQTVLCEAKRVARDIVRGNRVESSNGKASHSEAGLSFEQFEQVQEKHYGLSANQRKAAKTLAKFTTVWGDFKRFLEEERRGRIQTVQQVTEEVSLEYLEWLKAKAASAYGIKSKVAVLGAAWNRVRRGHPKSKKTISQAEKCSNNPWEEIRGELPQTPDTDPVQLNLEQGELQKLLAALDGRPVAQLLIKVSLFAAGRLEEMTLSQWDWVDDQGYVDIPDEVAKRGKGRVVRLPPSILSQLRAHRIPGSPYIFAGFTEELRRRSLRHSSRIREFHPGTYDLICKHVVKAAKKAGLDGVSHHALRRTAMELSDQGEEIKPTEESSKNLGTTTKNKQRFYVRKTHGKTYYLRADRLYESISMSLVALYPAAAVVLGVEDRFIPKPEESVREKVGRLLEEMASLSEDEVIELERQRASQRLKKG